MHSLREHPVFSAKVSSFTRRVKLEIKVEPKKPDSLAGYQMHD